MSDAKYIKDKEGNIIVFPALIEHAKFKHKEPQSAGFISFGTNVIGNPNCKCYGHSASLDMAHDPEDTELAMLQILCYGRFTLEENMA